jgi:dolichyl-phosphate-mannose-protein mannosyltransferase
MELSQRKKAPEIVPAVQEEKEKVVKASKPTHNKFALLFVTILAVITRTYVLHHPHEVVFDEVHFGKFASYYLRGEYYFDVHPPLGKMLLALVGYVVGYDGHFLFDNIGDDYYQHSVPFIAFRFFCAIVGAGVIPVSFLVLEEIGCSTVSCIFGCLLLVFDTALIAQSRLILLDSMLMFFCALALLFWVRFHSIRQQEFTMEWWFRLLLTGVGLALCTGVKMVGLFTVAVVGVATLFDLWELLDYKRTTFKKFSQHFMARALCLILVPVLLYVVPFYIHFKLLPMSGPGDAFMSVRFQETLQGNQRTAGSTNVIFGSEVTLQHQGTSHFLHSHTHRYPLRHEDGRVSSQGQQVNGYGHSDPNSIWKILPVDNEYYKDEFELSTKEKERNVRYLKHDSIFRLRHVSTDSYLVTHDVASPLTTTNMEVTTLSEQDTIPRYNDSVWKVVVFDDEDPRHVVRSKRDTVAIVNAKFNVALHTHKKLLPDWGFKMQEINGNKKLKENSNHWQFANVTHANIIDGSTN